MSVFRTAAILALIAQPLVADEVWDTDMGPIVYQAEEAGTAIFTFTNVDAYTATLIIPGLAGNYDNRSTHDAMWIGQGSGECETFMSRSGVGESSQWGRARLVFDKPAYPTSMTVVLGYCMDEPHIVLRGEIR